MKVSIVVCFLGFCGAVLGTHVTTDCRRTTVIADICSGTGDCPSTGDSGDCTCTGGAPQTVDCQIPAGYTVDAADCPAPALDPCSGGTCYDDVAGAGYLCECTDLKYDTTGNGDVCDGDRFVVECDPIGDDMTLYAVPGMKDFNGKIFQAGQPACEMTEIGTSGRYSVTVDNTGGPGTCAAATVDGEDLVQKFFVAYGDSGNVESVSDNLLTFRCDSTQTATSPFTGTVSVTTAVDDLASTDIDGLGSTTISMSATLPGGGALPSPIPITQRMRLLFQTDTAGTGFLVKQCTWEDAATAQPKDIYFDYCLTSFGRQVGSSLVVESGADKELFTYPYFLTTQTANDDYTLTCTVVVCSVAADCVAQTCAASTPGDGFGRKKREAEGVEETHRITFRVAGSTPTDVEPHRELNNEECPQSWEMTATVIALGAGLLLVLVLCTVLAVKVITYRKTRANEKC